MFALAKEAAENVPEKNSINSTDITNLLKDHTVNKYQKLSKPFQILSKNTEILTKRCAEFISFLL